MVITRKKNFTSPPPKRNNLLYIVFRQIFPIGFLSSLYVCKSTFAHLFEHWLCFVYKLRILLTESKHMKISSYFCTSYERECNFYRVSARQCSSALNQLFYSALIIWFHSLTLMHIQFQWETRLLFFTFVFKCLLYIYIYILRNRRHMGV